MSAFEARLCTALGARDTEAVLHALDRLEEVLGLGAASAPREGGGGGAGS
ncbi:hypothetical protein K9U40_04005 [Xanthobacter autotrophicus]|nr:hypothetical protein [Xanthobacter autotrophicus]MDI4663503.1 hypothetical protein [Xanthobacter autotrophicus]